MTLNPQQQSYLSSVPADLRAQVAQRLLRGGPVVIYLHEEGDAPPFAVAPVDEQGFWIGCWETSAEAVTRARELGFDCLPD